jgi:hypothetical protein
MTCHPIVIPAGAVQEPAPARKPKEPSMADKSSYGLLAAIRDAIDLRGPTGPELTAHLEIEDRVQKNPDLKDLVFRTARSGAVSFHVPLSWESRDISTARSVFMTSHSLGGNSRMRSSKSW